MSFKRGQNPHQALDIGLDRKEAKLLYKFAYQYTTKFYNKRSGLTKENTNPALLTGLCIEIKQEYLSSIADETEIINQAINDVLVFLKLESYNNEMLIGI